MVGVTVLLAVVIAVCIIDDWLTNKWRALTRWHYVPDDE